MTPTTTASLFVQLQSRFGRFPLFRRTLLPTLLLLLTLTARGQTTRFVSTTGTNTNPASATSWATSTTNLQGAIDAAGVTQVWVARGTYKPGGNTNTNRSSSFAMKNGVTIYGGFVGTETLLSQRPAINPLAGQPSSTTLSGEIGNPSSTTDNSYHVINIPSGLNSTALLDGVVITGGNANGIGGDGIGGAIINTQNSNPSLTNCSFLNNTANQGGAIYNFSSNPSLSNCNFQNNNANNGGAIVNEGSSPSLTNCSFLNNNAGGGGAIYNVFGSRPSLANCSFLNNSAGSGGAIFNDSSHPSLTNCSFLSNNATSNGGAIINTQNSSPSLTNCSLLNNTAQEGGAICSFFNIHISLSNCVFFGNGDSNTFFNRIGSTLTASYSLFDAVVTGYTSVTGNLTTTTSPFVSLTSVALLAGSPAINAGNPNSQTALTGPFSATALPQTDLAGNPRIARGLVDMGAVEFQGPFILSLLTAASPNPVCAGSSPTLSVTASSGATPYSYTWTAPAGITLGATSASAVSASVSAALSGVQTLTVRVADSSPTPIVSTSTVSLTISPRPTAGILAPASTTLTCTTPTLTLTATGGTSYSFARSGGGGIVSQNASAGTAEVNASGTYSVTVVNAAGCFSTTTVTISSNIVVPTRLYVRASATGLNTGLSWTDAFTDLQSALTYPCSQSLTEIWVAGGGYKPTSTTARTVSFVMKNGVVIYGGFAGTETLLSQRPAISLSTPSSTTLSGDIDNDGTLNNNTYHIINNPAGLTATAVLDGFVITGGNSIGAGGSLADYGGGMLNSLFNTNNQVCSPLIRNCLFQNNTARYGGAIANIGDNGGSSSPTVFNCWFQNNTASSEGSAIYNNSFRGGSSNPELVNCLFRNNSSGTGGAMANRGNTSPQLTNCSFLNNSTNGSGGAIKSVAGGTMRLTNCSFVGNSTSNGYGGALYSNGIANILTNCSLLNNSAPGLSGGAMFIDFFFTGANTAQFTNCILFGNGGVQNDFRSNGGSFEVNYSMLEYARGETNLTTTTSPFVSLTSVALLAGSPAINAGNPASQTALTGPFSATALPQTDLAGNPRIVRGRVDMGAVEFQGPFILSLLAAASPNPVCAGGSSTTLSVMASSGATPYSYTWTAPAGITLGATSASAVSASVSAALSGVQTLTVRVADSSPTPIVSTSTVSLTINPLPTAGILAPASTTLTCTTPTLTLTATGGGTYRWDNNALTPARSVSASGTYSVTVTSAAGCTAVSSRVVNSATATITTTNPTINTAIASTAFSQTFTATSTGTASRTFALASGTLPTGLSVASTGVLSGTPTQSGSFTVAVRATDANGCSGLGAAYVLTVNNLTPTLTGFGGSSASICQGGRVTFTATVGNVTTPYAFTLANGTSTTTGTQSSTAFSQNWTSAGSGAQAFTLTVSQSGQTTRVTTSLTVVALPTAGISLPANLTVTCASPSVAITATGGGTYRWDNSTTSAIRSITVTTGTYAVTVTNASGCSASSSSLVTVTQNTSPPALVLSATNVCQGGAVRLSATAGLTSYTFSRSDGSVISSGAANTATVSGLSAGSYTLTVRGINSAGCTSTTTTSATVLALPSLTLTARNSVGALSTTLTCAQTALTLTASGGTSYTFAGTGILALGASATVSQAGTFTLTGRNASGCQSTTTLTIQSNTATVSVTLPPTNTALAGVAFSQNFGASGGQTPYSFSVATGLLPTGLSLSPAGSLTGTPTQTGTFNVTVRGTDANGCSGLSSVYSLTVRATDVGSLSVTPNAVCAGGRVTFAASVSNISGSYTFTLTNGTSTTTGSTTNTAFSQPWTAAGSGLQTFTLIVDDNGTPDQITATLTVNPQPSAGISVPANLTLTCASPTVTLTATGGTSYRWEDNSINAERSINATGTYTVTVTNGSGCTAVASQLVTVSQNSTLPNVSLSGANVCEGESVSLVATSGLSSYTFIGSEGILDSGPDPSLEVTELLAGVYSFTVRVVNTAGCVNTATTSVTVHAPPTPMLSASNNGLLTCAQTSLTLTATGGNNYAFAGTGLQSQNPTAGTAVVNQTGLFSVTVTNTLTGCFSTTDITIGQDITLPPVAISPNSGTLTCASPTLTLTATGGMSYTWTASPALPGGSSTGSTLPVSASGTYSVTATGANGCTASASVSIGQSAELPVASLVASGTLTCAQTTVELTATGGDSYAFSGPSGGPSGLVSQNASAGTAEVNLAGVYSVTVTDTVTGCSSVTSTTVSQNTAAPSASVSPASATLTCDTRLISLTASGGASLPESSNYQWSNNFIDRVINVNSPGTYSVVVTNANGCTAAASVVVDQRSDLPALIVVASGTLTCAQTAVTLTATGGDTYEFQGTGIVSQDATAGTAVVSRGGTFGVIVSNTTTGCLNSTNITVSQNTTLPIVSISASRTVLTCNQASLTLTATSSGTGLLWSNAATTTSITVNSGGTYSVTATAGNGCTSVADWEVIADQIPPSIPQLVASDNALLTCNVRSLTLTASAGGDDLGYVFAGLSGTLAGSGNTRPVSASGLYSVTITGANGCTTSVSTTVSSNTEAPSLTVTPGSGTLTCAQPSLTLTASGSATSYVWTASPALAGGGAATASVPVSASGTYSVTATAANGCTSTTSVVVSRNADLPTAGLAASGTLTCTQTAVTLTASGGSSYTFTGPDLSQSGSSATAVVSAGGTYTVTVGNANGCTSTTTTTVLSNTTAPMVSISATSGTLTCATASITLTATSSATALLWSNAATTQSITVNSVGTYSVTATAANGCSAVSNMITVQSNTAAPANASLTAGNSGTLTCAVQTLTLTATATDGAGLPASLSYVFAGLSGTLSGSGNTRPVSASGVYSVTITGANGCTTSVSTTVFSNTATPTAGMVASGTITCSTPAITLTASGLGTYSFSGPVGGPTGIVSTAGNSATVNAQGTYSVTVTNPTNGCSASTTVTVSSNTAGSLFTPTLSASSSVVCTGTNVLVIATVGGAPSGLQWYRNGSPVAGQTSATLSLGGVQQPQAGSYVLVVTGGCSTTSTPFNLTVNPLPTVTLLVPNNATVQGATITVPTPLTGVNFQVLGGISFERLIIIDRINGFEIRQVDSNANGLFPVTRTGPYRLTVTDGNGCRRTVEGTVVMQP